MMRKFINIITESQSRSYYHGSCDKLSVGTRLVPRPDYENNWSGTDFYTALERYRPDGMLAHKDAVFMCANEDDIDLAGGCTDWLFTVEPDTRIERHDLNWSSEVSMLVSDGAPEEQIKVAALNYWNGVPHHDENVWEYLTTGAVIVAVEEY